MPWNWQQPDWPRFTFDPGALAPLEQRFLLKAGEIFGVFRHVRDAERDVFRIELIGEEALSTSAIEGEILDRKSLQSSLRQQFRLDVRTHRVPAREDGIAQMMADTYSRFAEPLSHQLLWSWHAMIFTQQSHLHAVGAYRVHHEPMQIVSGSIDRPRVHFEAPPSDRLASEMDRFIHWYNDSAPGGAQPLAALTRAALAHLYFESIHPFEDGNGRIGRAISEKALAQNIGQPSLVALAYTIERHRTAYYDELEAGNKSNMVTPWLLHFSQTILKAQETTFRRIEFLVSKTKFYDVFRDRLNVRQKKVVERLFRAGVEGFKGGLSAENYVSITGTSRATATRDLQDLVIKGALTRTGERRHTRYQLSL